VGKTEVPVKSSLQSLVVVNIVLLTNYYILYIGRAGT
jgi:hypothetical protein